MANITPTRSDLHAALRVILDDVAYELQRALEFADDALPVVSDPIREALTSIDQARSDAA